MNKIKLILLTLTFLLLCSCVKKASLNNIEYKGLKNKFEKDETFILSIENNKQENYKKYIENINKIVNDYNINIISININNINKKEKKELEKLTNVSSSNILIFIKDGMEDNSNNRVNSNMTNEQMIEIFKSAEYID